MGPSMGLPKLSRLSLFCLVTTNIVSVHASHHLFARQDQTCGGKSDLQQCGGDFPSEFCCSAGSTCTALNSTDVQAVLCCPSGANCDFIQPITCELDQFNATQHPDNQIHFSETEGVELPKCGDKCCPLGYSCNGDMCTADKEKPSPTSSISPTSSATDPASVSQTSDAAPPAAVATSDGFSGKSFAAGFFPGIVIGILGTLGLLWVIKKRRESQARERFSGDFGHVARTISDPIYDPAYAHRTDFIRQPSPTPSSLTGVVQRNLGTKAAGGDGGGGGGLTPKIKSMWDRTPKLSGFSGWSSLPSNPAQPAPPPPVIRAGSHNDPYTTPPQQSAAKRSNSRRVSKNKPPLNGRSSSSETIDVLMPAPNFLEPPKAPGMRENRMTSDSSNTTFTKLMERAGYEESSRNDVRNWKGSPAKHF